MDNLTHVLTGALTAKFIEARPTAPEEKKTYRRTFFWLFVLCANLPDIDVALGLIGDPILSIQYHRGITHSVLFAPLFALFPAAGFRLLTRVRNIRLLWVISLLGIITHIFFDLITSFGTQILSPVSSTRYALDWLFIIDPVFTLSLGTALLLGKIFPNRRRQFTSIMMGFVVLYLVAAALTHGIARSRIKEAAAREGISWERVSALPALPTILQWHGLVQSHDGVWQTFFSVFDGGLPELKFVPHVKGPFFDKAEREAEVQWYLTFARHPSFRAQSEGDREIVAFTDLMFSADESLARSLGFTERFLPFVLSYVYGKDGTLLEVKFDGKTIERTDGE